MTNDNNTHPVPTEPGWYYRAGGSIVSVDTDGDGLYYWIAGYPNATPVTDDGLWGGPVPMPGEWAPREIADCLYYEARNVDNSDSELLRRYEALTGIEATP